MSADQRFINLLREEGFPEILLSNNATTFLKDLLPVLHAPPGHAASTYIAPPVVQPTKDSNNLKPKNPIYHFAHSIDEEIKKKLKTECDTAIYKYGVLQHTPRLVLSMTASETNLQVAICSTCNRTLSQQSFRSHCDLCSAAMPLEQTILPPPAPAPLPQQPQPVVEVKRKRDRENEVESEAKKQRDAPAPAVPELSKYMKQKLAKSVNLDEMCGVKTETGAMCNRPLNCDLHSNVERVEVRGRSGSFMEILRAWRLKSGMSAEDENDCLSSDDTCPKPLAQKYYPKPSTAVFELFNHAAILKRLSGVVASIQPPPAVRKPAMGRPAGSGRAAAVPGPTGVPVAAPAPAQQQPSTSAANVDPSRVALNGAPFQPMKPVVNAVRPSVPPNVKVTPAISPRVAMSSPIGGGTAFHGGGQVPPLLPDGAVRSKGGAGSSVGPSATASAACGVTVWGGQYWVAPQKIRCAPLNRALFKKYGEVVLPTGLDVNSAMIIRTPQGLLKAAVTSDRGPCVELEHSVVRLPDPLEMTLIKGDRKGTIFADNMCQKCSQVFFLVDAIALHKSKTAKMTTGAK